MLKDLISKQKSIFSQEKYMAGRIKSTFQELKSEGDSVIALLVLEEKDRFILLFILQDDPYFVSELKGEACSPLSFSDYFAELSQTEGKLFFYEIDPVFFKALLVLAQKKPSIVGTADILDVEALLSQIERKKREAILRIKKREEVNLFYFREGVLSSGYFQASETMAKEGSLREQLLVYTYSSDEAVPMEIELFYDLNVGPAGDADDALEALGDGVEQLLASRPRLILKEAEGASPCSKIVDKEIFTLGRDLRNDWGVKDPMVSREHAFIKQESDGFYLEDRGSRNGTYLNKEKTVRNKLSDRDEIMIGTTVLIFSEKKEESLDSEPADLSPVSSEETKDNSGTWLLELLSGSEIGRFYELPLKRVSIGRGKTDIVLNDSKASRHHADLVWSEKGFTLTDLNSTNGIFVNDHRVQEKLLSPNDTFIVGETRFRVVFRK
ncbi:MAG: FHA domain-containing protein [Candidatus Manganitrophaceae bacterium]